MLSSFRRPVIENHRSLSDLHTQCQDWRACSVLCIYTVVLQRPLGRGPAIISFPTWPPQGGTGQSPQRLGSQGGSGTAW